MYKTPAFALSSPQPKKLRKPKKPRKPPVSLNDQQLLALLDIAYKTSLRDHLMILVSYWHGLRASETTSLVLEDFLEEPGSIRIRRGKGSEGGLHTLQPHENPLLDEPAAVNFWLANREQFGVKGRANPDGRRVRKSAQSSLHKMQQSTHFVTFLPNHDDLHAIIAARGRQDLLASKNVASAHQNAGSGHPASNLARQARLFPIGRVQFWRIVHGYALAVGIPRRKCKTHMLKHTIAKHLVRAGHPLNEIQEWMGWTTIETMNWYTRADEEELGMRIGNTIRGKAGLRPLQQPPLAGLELNSAGRDGGL